jgi:hypothetical protein
MYKFLTSNELLSILNSAYAFEVEGSILYFSTDSVDDKRTYFALYNPITNIARTFLLENAEAETTKLYLYEKDTIAEKKVLTVLSQTIAVDLIFRNF